MKTFKLFSLLTLCLFLVACNRATPEDQNIDDTSMPSQLEDQGEASTLETFSGKVTDVLKRGQNITCIIEHDESGTFSQGQIFVAGEKMRGEFTIKSEEGTAQSHMISDGEYTWIWSDLMPQGIKSEIPDDPDTLFEESEEVGNDIAPADFNQEFDYSCEAWKVDQSMFTPPSDVEFQDMSAMMQQFQDQIKSSGDGQDYCSACAQLSGDAKAQCESALGC